ncbi:MAG: hypothetical protein II363_04905 [Clostridia bacterium]|nr:hypothetical protein [Clostridia bacterium]
MKKQIKNETESYYLKFLSDKYCSFKNDSVPLKFNATEESNESAFPKDNKYKNSGTSSNKK